MRHGHVADAIRPVSNANIPITRLAIGAVAAFSTFVPLRLRTSLSAP